jgi:DNA-directed RNA polymerase subunit K/omega
MDHSDIYISNYENNIIHQTYEKNKKDFKTRNKLTKYELTRILSERTQQIQDGAKILIQNPDIYPNIYTIAYEELRQKKLPFFIERNIGNQKEIWKLDDLL